MKRMLFSLVILVSVTANAIDLFGVYPTNWWTGMKNPKLQLMIHGDNIGNYTSAKINYPGVSIIRLNKTENKNYLFLDLQIAPTAKPGKFKIVLSGGSMAVEDFSYELKPRSRENGKTRNQGISSSDLLYLMIPDRFSNGDASNDVIPEYRDHNNDRKNMFSRHGGDFKGIQDHFDYFNELGVTALWLTPVIENNVTLTKEWGNTVAGYHGYWFTDHYQVDKRLGGNEGYLAFCDAAHRKGIKVVQDAIYNHVSREHWFVTDPPSGDWLNNWPAFTGPNHREETLFDPYASSYDKKKMLDGWFTDHLPDLNQRNPFLANFLIQHAIWSTEYFGVDGWRVDTYKYCDEAFLNRVNTALEKEFPRITIFGEAWVNSVIGNAYFTQNNMNSGFHHNANSVIDFQTCFAMQSGMTGSQGWTEGVNKLYMTMAQDLVYKNPMRNCIFLDNHDMDRVFSVADENWERLKMAINWLLTLRGIPQLYYGTEVLMKNKKTNGDASVREDFPGGWPDDKRKDNRFFKEGRNEKQNEAFDHISRLAHFRKNSSAITSGRTMQFVPVEGLYIYFRYDNKQTVMVAANTGKNPVHPDWNIYTERTAGFNSVRDVVTGKMMIFEKVVLQPGESLVLELLK
jgi:neopullulanase